MRWRAWYDDGSTYASTNTPWRDLPATGMVGAVVYLSTTATPYRQIADGGDWYWLADGRAQVSGTVWDGYVDPPEGVPAEMLKRSGRLDDDAWAEVQREMLEAREAPR